MPEELHRIVQHRITDFSFFLQSYNRQTDGEGGALDTEFSALFRCGGARSEYTSELNCEMEVPLLTCAALTEEQFVHGRWCSVFTRKSVLGLGYPSK